MSLLEKLVGRLSNQYMGSIFLVEIQAPPTINIHHQTSYRMDTKDRSTINIPRNKADKHNNHDMTSAWNIVSLEEQRTMTDPCISSISKAISPENFREMENTLKDLVKKEEYVRNLRQDVEHKLRIIMLSEASSGLTK